MRGACLEEMGILGMIPERPGIGMTAAKGDTTKGLASSPCAARARCASRLWGGYSDGCLLEYCPASTKCLTVHKTLRYSTIPRTVSGYQG